MIPLIIYEALPAVYLTMGVLLLSFADLPLLLFSASVFYFVGAAIEIWSFLVYGGIEEVAYPAD